MLKCGEVLDAKLKQVFEKALTKVDDQETRGPRLVDDAVRLSGRLHAFVKMNFVQGELNIAALEIACYAVQLPLRQQKLLPTGKLGRSNLKDRAEQASEMLVSGFADYIEAVLQYVASSMAGRTIVAHDDVHALVLLVVLRQR